MEQSGKTFIGDMRNFDPAQHFSSPFILKSLKLFWLRSTDSSAKKVKETGSKALGVNWTDLLASGLLASWKRSHEEQSRQL